MRNIRLSGLSRPLIRHGASIRVSGSRFSVIPRTHSSRGLFTRSSKRKSSNLFPTVFVGGLITWLLYPSDDFSRLSNVDTMSRGDSSTTDTENARQNQDTTDSDDDDDTAEASAWASFAKRFEDMSVITDREWFEFSDKLADFMLPDWGKLIPGYVKKLQRELSMSPGSLAAEIWEDAHDPAINPEIQYTAEVRVSSELCKEEQEFLTRRRKIVKVALAKYLDIDEKDIHPDDVPTIAMCGSGGGLRALVAGTGSLLATDEDGLFDCVTYTAGVSGSCWLQLLYMNSFTQGSIPALLQHLKARTGTHIAYPPVALQSLVSLPTSKHVLSGLVEKLRGDPHADFGLVDIYGLLLASRFLVPKGELGVNDRDFKLSQQREHIKHGERPLPIYTAVRHEIPDLDKPKEKSELSAEEAEQAKKKAWFQWYEITPYEFFCEEFGAGIPTWALGRKFNNGKDVPPESGFHLPEIRVPLLMGIFGSAFCATLSHYYKEIQPVVQGLSGFGAVDELISGKDDDLSKIHPIDPARLPNYVYGMQGKLPQAEPQTICDNEYIQLMDAGMSNNLPIYPLLRPDRNVDVLVSFDASADVKTDNWLSVADGYARQRGIKGWPVGIGWPKADQSSKQTRQDLADAEAHSPKEADQKLKRAQAEQEALRADAERKGNPPKPTDAEGRFESGHEEAGDLGPCTVWVGTIQETAPDAPPASRPVASAEHWRVSHPDAGIAIVYLPFLENPKVPGISPGTTDFMSTWNFVYTPEQIDKVVQLARANYDEGKQQIKSTVRAVYERKKQQREQREKQLENTTLRGLAKRGEKALLGEGDQFS